MARVLGESGRYVTQEAVKKRRRIYTTGIILVAIVFSSLGFLAGFGLRTGTVTLATSGLLFLITPGLVWLIAWFFCRKLDLLEKERVRMRKGAVGEAAVAAILADLPDEFYVIDDLTTPFGNIDHVVVGPTGVFVIDTKNWRGVVDADGHGELLFNGKPTEKPMVRQLVGRLMAIKEQVKTLSRLDPYFQGVMAFISARVDANWGATGSVHCLRDDQLYDYVVEGKTKSKLNQNEIESLAQAFLAVARMDKKFESASNAIRSG